MVPHWIGISVDRYFRVVEDSLGELGRDYGRRVGVRKGGQGQGQGTRERQCAKHKGIAKEGI